MTIDKSRPFTITIHGYHGARVAATPQGDQGLGSHLAVGSAMGQMRQTYEVLGLASMEVRPERRRLNAAGTLFGERAALKLTYAPLFAPSIVGAEHRRR